MPSDSTPSDDRLDAHVPQRPDSLYGVSKAFGEDLASFFADKYGMDIACLRIGTARPDPVEPANSQPGKAMRICCA